MIKLANRRRKKAADADLFHKENESTVQLLDLGAVKVLHTCQVGGEELEELG